VAASLRNNIAGKLIFVWAGWHVCTLQLHPKVLCFITSVLILVPVPLLLLAVSPLPGSLAGFLIHHGEKRGSMLWTSSIKCFALLEGLRRDQGRIWTGNLSTICVPASVVLPGQKMLSLSTEYEFLAPLCHSVLAFPGGVEHSRTIQQPLMVNVPYTVCCSSASGSLAGCRPGASGGLGTKPLRYLHAGEALADMVTEPSSQNQHESLLLLC